MAVETRFGTFSRLPFAVPADPIWRLSIEQFHQMTRTGILTDDDPVELLEGWLVTKMPKNPLHRLSVQLLREALERLLPSRWHVNDQEPITTEESETEESEPEPDIAIVRGERREYLERHPAPADLALVIEVSDTTLQRDRTGKKRIYARAAIPEYWIVNLAERHVEVYSKPQTDALEPDYQERRDYSETESIPLVIEGHEIGRLSISAFLP
jgi:Uma2 family endonuclease